jgi:hypothetical protein
MTPQQIADTLAMAKNVLAEDEPGAMRRRWANDVIAWLERGDMAAAARCGFDAQAGATQQGAHA